MKNKTNIDAAALAKIRRTAKKNDFGAPAISLAQMKQQLGITATRTRRRSPAQTYGSPKSEISNFRFQIDIPRA